MGREFNERILREVAQFKAQTQRLKERTDYYPLVLIDYEGLDECGHNFVASTLVRKEWNGKWYTIHCVQRHCAREVIKENAEKVARGYLLGQLIGLVHNTQHLYIITGECRHEDLDVLQQSEQDRLIELMPGKKNRNQSRKIMSQAKKIENKL